MAPPKQWCKEHGKLLYVAKTEHEYCVNTGHKELTRYWMKCPLWFSVCNSRYQDKYAAVFHETPGIIEGKIEELKDAS